MLRRKPGAPRPVDEVDQELVEGVEAELPWQVLIRSASCSEEEAEQRILRLIRMEFLEGLPGVDTSSSRSNLQPVTVRSSFVPKPMPIGVPASSPPTRPSVSAPVARPGLTVPPRGVTPTEPPRNLAPRPSQPVPTSGPKPIPTGEALLRQLRAMRGGLSQPPAEALGRSGPPPRPTTSMLPARSSTNAPPGQSGRFVVDSPLGALIEEYSQGTGMHRWASARLREALEEELAGNFLQALAALQVVLAQIEDPRLRTERTRLQEKSMRATSGVYRSRAMEAERGNRHLEAAEQWRKVLEAFPADAEAALHAAKCYMEAGELKQAAHFARNATLLAPDNISAHKLLLRFFKKTGMEASAQRQREILDKLRKAQG